MSHREGEERFFQRLAQSLRAEALPRNEVEAALGEARLLAARARNDSKGLRMSIEEIEAGASWFEFLLLLRHLEEALETVAGARGGKWQPLRRFLRATRPGDFPGRRGGEIPPGLAARAASKPEAGLIDTGRTARLDSWRSRS